MMCWGVSLWGRHCFRCCIMMTVVLFDGFFKSVRDKSTRVYRYEKNAYNEATERERRQERTKKGCELCWMDREEGICRSGWQPKKKKNWGETCSSDVVSDPLLCKYYVRRLSRWRRWRWGGVKEDFIMEYENLFLAALLVALLYEKKTCLIFCNLFCGMIIFLWEKKKKFRTMV